MKIDICQHCWNEVKSDEKYVESKNNKIHYECFKQEKIKQEKWDGHEWGGIIGISLLIILLIVLCVFAFTV